MNVLFACTGTAGHINPALAIADKLREIYPDSRILFVGAGREMERRLIPKAGYEFVNIKMSGLRRKVSPKALLHNIKTVRNLMAANAEVSKIIRDFSPHAAIGTGGYVCYPILKKAAKMGVPTLIHESNAITGLTTKMLSSIVDKVLVSFPGLEKDYRKPERVVFTGTPVRGGFSMQDGQDVALPEDTLPLVLSFWGSLGAERMNEIIAEFIMLNSKNRKFDHIHATGKKGGQEEMKNRLGTLGVTQELPHWIEVREYIDDIEPIMAAADIVLCRAGGSTIAELTAMGKPAILVPSPYVSNNEQDINARQLEKAGGAVVIEEKSCSGKILFDTVLKILNDDSALAGMSDAQKKLGVPDAAEKIVDLIVSLVKRVES